MVSPLVWEVVFISTCLLLARDIQRGGHAQDLQARHPVERRDVRQPLAVADVQVFELFAVRQRAEIRDVRGMVI